MTTSTDCSHKLVHTDKKKIKDMAMPSWQKSGWQKNIHFVNISLTPHNRTNDIETDLNWLRLTQQFFHVRSCRYRSKIIPELKGQTLCKNTAAPAFQSLFALFLCKPNRPPRRLFRFHAKTQQIGDFFFCYPAALSKIT